MDHITSAHPVLPSDNLRLENVLIPDVYWQLGKEYPQRVFARVMDGDNDEQPLINITWGRVLRDSSSVASFLSHRISGLRAPLTIGILASSSYVYYSHMVASWLNGWTVIFLSDRNSNAGLESLLKDVCASALIVDTAHSRTGEILGSQISGLRVIPMKGLDPAGEDPIVGLLAYPPRAAPPSDAELDTVVAYTHTSGSQGHPKPIPTTNRDFLADIRVRAAAKYAGASAYAPLPLFHGMGFYAFTRWPMSSGLIPTFVNMKQPLNAQALLRHLKRLPGSISFLPPIVLEEAIRESSLDLSVLASCKRIFFGGAPMNHALAQALIERGVPLVGAFGSSECGLISDLDFPTQNVLEDWQYFRFSLDNRFTLHFLPIDDTDVREMVISPGPGASPAVINRQNPVGFASNDLWLPHPTVPGLWKHVGRKDAVTVLSNGEKTDNKQIESILMQDKRIAAVAVFGGGKSLNGVLLVPSQEFQGMQRDRFLDSIWETVERANTIIPKHSRLIRQLVLVSTVGKPVATTDKGTLRTKETLALYSEEINTAYLEVEVISSTSVLDRLNQDAILPFVRRTVNHVLKHLGDDDDLFEAGLDSLQAVQVRLELLPILGAFSVRGASVPHNLVYYHPTISRLSKYAAACQGRGSSITPPLQERSARVSACVDRFSAGFASDLPVTRRTRPIGGERSIIITGGTGSLGCHLLYNILPRVDVKAVFCFHRGSSSTAGERLIQVFQERHIPVDPLLRHAEKLQFVAIDLSHPTLGLSAEFLEKIYSEVTEIIHTAWELNFNWDLERFERDHLAGVRHLINLAMSCHRFTPPRLVFTSSIGTVGRYQGLTPVPEQPFEDPSLISGHGYSEAKYVAERMIDHACAAGLYGTVIRVGQISGATLGGFWAASEHVPTLLRSSAELGVVPDSLPETRWLPADIVAKCILDITFQNEPSRLVYYHLENLTSTPWSEVVRLYSSAVGVSLKFIPAGQWLDLVEKSGIGTVSGEKKSRGTPAVALLQFYHEFLTAAHEGSWVSLDVSRAQAICPAVDFGPVTMELMFKYAKWIG